MKETIYECLLIYRGTYDSEMWAPDKFRYSISTALHFWYHPRWNRFSSEGGNLSQEGNTSKNSWAVKSFRSEINSVEVFYSLVSPHEKSYNSHSRISPHTKAVTFVEMDSYTRYRFSVYLVSTLVRHSAGQLCDDSS